MIFVGKIVGKYPISMCKTSEFESHPLRFFTCLARLIRCAIFVNSTQFLVVEPNKGIAGYPKASQVMNVGIFRLLLVKCW